MFAGMRRGKFRHVYGQEKAEEALTDLRISQSAWDSNKVVSNHLYTACITIGGSMSEEIVVMKNSMTGSCTDAPRIRGFSGHVLDVDLSPFMNRLCVSGGEDTLIKIWRIPAYGLEEDLHEPIEVLRGHKRKVGRVKFHPTADNVLISASTDYQLKLWDVEKGSEYNSFCICNDMIKSVEWSYNGSRIACTSKDKILRVLDPRLSEVAMEAPTLTGVKGTRCLWLGETELLLTIGFSRQAERMIQLSDPRKLTEPLDSTQIDCSAGILMPSYDNDTKLIFAAGKGDGDVKIFQLEDEKIRNITSHRTRHPCLGMAMRPKTSCNVLNCEIACMVRAIRGSLVPIHFLVPRKNDCFQEDLFPDTAGPYPTLTSQEWFNGENQPPPKVELPFEPVDFSRAKSARK